MWCTRSGNTLLASAAALFLITACGTPGQPSGAGFTTNHQQAVYRKYLPALPDTCELERYLLSQELVNVQDKSPGIRVALAYATANNFLHRVMYHDLERCYLPAEVAAKLAKAESYLNNEYPDYHLVVFDGVRPLHIQQQMWDSLPMPDWKKINYLANPADLSLHNYGAAVDVGIIDERGSLLDMGTSFDTFSELSQPKLEQRFLSEGSLSPEAYQNRLLLRRAMQQAGFSMMHTEWWHFNATNKATAAARYRLIQ